MMTIEEEWKYAWEDSGGLCVIISGTTMMLQLCVNNLVMEH